MGMWDLPAQHYVGDTELRFNPYHDPTTGRFTTANGGGLGAYLFSKGGKSAYVVASENFSKGIGNSAQNATMKRMDKILTERKSTSVMPKYSSNADGSIGFQFELKDTYAHVHGGKMQDPLKDDIMERTTKRSGIIKTDGKISWNKDEKSETLIKKGRNPVYKSGRSSSSGITAYTINAGTPSQYFGLKDAEGNFLHTPNNWKTEKGALNWAKKNGLI